jgi:hypothetical protein
MLATAISWYFKQRHKELWDLASKAIENQKDLLEYFVEKLRLTEYGQNFGVRTSLNYSQYKDILPVVGYEELKPYIQRTMKGEQQLIWPADITWFAKSSGTTSNESKYIPITFESLEYTHFKGSKEPLTQFHNFYPKADIFEGKAILIGGTNRMNDVYSKSYQGDLSAILMHHMPAWANFKSTPDVEIMMMDNWEDKLQKMALATIKENVTSISGVPTWTMVLLNRVLEITGKEHIHEVWPNLQLFIHGGMSFEPYRETYKKLIPGEHMKYIETYNASEGFFGVQASKEHRDMLLMTHHGVFFEFYPVSKGPDHCVPLWEVETGINYAVVVTNTSGLWRYVIGDTIEFTQLDPFLFKFTGRTKLFINAFGEELIMDNAETAVTQTCLNLGLRVIDYTGAPCFTKGLEGHEWIFEFEVNPSSLDEFIKVFDAELKKVNSDYAGKRVGDLLMKMPRIHLATKETFKRWLQDKGKLGGQNKVPRLANHRTWLEEILQFI